MHVFAVARDLAPLDQTLFFHRLHRDEGGGLHDARLFAEFALGNAIARPEHTQKGPVTERHIEGRQTLLERPHLRAGNVSHQMRHPIVGDRLTPMTQDRSCGIAPAHQAVWLEIRSGGAT